MKSLYYELAQDLYAKSKEGRVISSGFSYGLGSPYPIGQDQPEAIQMPTVSIPDPEPITQSGRDDDPRPIEGYTRVLTSFSGADLVVRINDEPVGEMQAIFYHKIEPLFADLLCRDKTYFDAHMLKEYPIVMLATYTFFGTDPVRRPQPGQDMTIVMTYANEYGMRAEERFNGVDVFSEFGGISVDSIVSDRTVIMIAKEHLPMISIQN